MRAGLKSWWPLLPLVVFGGLLLYGTLKPFNFTWHPRRDRMNDRSQVEWIPFTRLCPEYGIFCPRDTGLNLVIFIPVGVLVALLPGARASAARRIGRATGCGFALSLMIETTQYFIPSRYPGATDLVLNTLGACLGGLLVTALFRRCPAVTSPRQRQRPGSG
jgi:glycopeptide antibiotics resistance protein